MLKGKNKSLEQITFCLAIYILFFSLFAAHALPGADASTPSAFQPSCGETVTQSVTLTADLNCAGTHSYAGLTIGGDGITIDLNGYTISGDGGAYSEIGIDNRGGYNNITLENGKIDNYVEGVWFEHTSGSQILNMSVGAPTGNSRGIGIFFKQSQNSVIDQTVVSGGVVGVQLEKNDAVNLLNSEISGSSVSGILDKHSKSVVRNVKSNDNGLAAGLLLEGPLAGYKVLDSTFNNNVTGVHIQGHREKAVSLISNTANNNMGYGFYAAAKTKGKGNHAHGNGNGYPSSAHLSQCFNVACGL